MCPKRILFVCLGNICRSPMAEAVFSKIVRDHGAQAAFEVDSAGLSSYHQGDLPDSRMRWHAERRGYTLTHRSRPVKREDFDRFDLIIGMDEENIRQLNRRAATPEQRAKIRRMADFRQRLLPDEVPDPYYGGDAGFETSSTCWKTAARGYTRRWRQGADSHPPRTTCPRKAKSLHP